MSTCGWLSGRDGHLTPIEVLRLMCTIRACEQRGIKTVFLTPEAGNSDGTGPPLYFYVPEATGMVSTGNLNTEPQLPAMTKVIGCGKGQLLIMRPGARPISPWSDVALDRWTEITEGVDWFGGMHLTCTEY